MSPTYEFVASENVPDDSTVCHYDQLGEDAKDRFPELLAESAARASVTSRVANQFSHCEYVKYTDYYHLRKR